MLKNSFLKTILILFLFVISAQVVDRYFFDQKMNDLGAMLIKRQMSYLFSRTESAGWRSGLFFRGLIGLRKVLLENESLKEENFDLLSRLADHEDLKHENEFLRKSLGIHRRFNGEVAYANIYQFQLGLDGYDVLLNKGAGDGITESDIIITEEGVLVGRIAKAYDNFSRVLVVKDTDFAVTAKVLNSDTAGIARGALAQGLYFDLIVQNDPIKESDVVVSSGMDLIPPGLVVGVVSYVETKDTDLFKKVKIRPAMGEIKIGRVLVIRN